MDEWGFRVEIYANSFQRLFSWNSFNMAALFKICCHVSLAGFPFFLIPNRFQPAWWQKRRRPKINSQPAAVAGLFIQCFSPPPLRDSQCPPAWGCPAVAISRLEWEGLSVRSSKCDGWLDTRVIIDPFGALGHSVRLAPCPDKVTRTQDNIYTSISRLAGLLWMGEKRREQSQNLGGLWSWTV